MPRVTQVNVTEFEKPEFQSGLNEFSRVFLAEGDSWFSFGSTKLHNVLSSLTLQDRACILNIAEPGDTLRRMHETTANPDFFFYLRNQGGRSWNAIFLSGGGNDLIDAIWNADAQRSEVLVQPTSPGNIDQTNLRSVINDDALAALFNFIKLNVAQVVAEGRDGAGSNSANVPIFMHTYALAQPRKAPVRHFNHGPWLFPACLWLGIHSSLWLDLSRLLLEELAACLKSIDLPNFHVVDTFTLTTTLIPADQAAEGDSHDWENEIHPNRRGYKKLADTWAVELGRLLPQ